MESASYSSRCAQCGGEVRDGVCSSCGTLATPASVPGEAAKPHGGMGWPYVTFVLIAINVAVFAAMVLRGVPLMKPTTEQLVLWGANFGPLTLGGQWWRLLSSMFLHIGLVHLLVNMWCFFQMGFLAERVYRSETYVSLYLLSGVAGAEASLARNPVVVSAGASGAIFGVAGALITTLYFGKLPVPKSALRETLRSLIVFAGFNLAYGFVDKQVDNGAHIGGLICGLLLGALLSHDALPGAHRASFRPLVIPAMVLVLLGGAYGLHRSDVALVQVNRARLALSRNKPADAIHELQILLSRKPGYVPAYALMGDIYLAQRKFPEAEAQYQKIMQLQPANAGAQTQLGAIYLATNQPQQAQAAFEKAIQLDPKNAVAYRDLGVLFQQAGKNADAMEAYRKAIAVEPGDLLSQYNLGILAMSAKEYDQAIAAFQQALRQRPQDPDLLTWLGNAYQGKGMNKEADDAFAKAYALKRKRQPARR